MLPAISAYLQSITPVDELGTFTATCLASMAGVTHIAIIPFDEITIISASDLNEDQKSQVVAALQANPSNADKQFTIDYEVDESIIGGLQMYTESEFMDMSLGSRMTRLSNEVSKFGA